MAPAALASRGLSYLDRLRSKYDLEINYRQLTLESNALELYA